MITPKYCVIDQHYKFSFFNFEIKSLVSKIFLFLPIWAHLFVEMLPTIENALISPFNTLRCGGKRQKVTTL